LDATLTKVPVTLKFDIYPGVYSTRIFLTKKLFGRALIASGLSVSNKLEALVSGSGIRITYHLLAKESQVHHLLAAVIPSQQLKGFMASVLDYEIESGYLLKYASNLTPRICVPEGLVSLLLRKTHDEVGHWAHVSTLSLSAQALPPAKEIDRGKNVHCGVHAMCHIRLIRNIGP
jgi:hypothetical protein